MRGKSFRIVSAIGLLALSFVLMFFFENCGKAGFESSNSSGTLDLSSSSTATTVPFAFTAAFDQIAYNSCSVATLAGKAGYYTLMGGAYQNGGVALSSDIISYTKNPAFVKPIYPATTISTDQIKSTIFNASNNVAAQPQMAFRLRSNMQQLEVPTAGQVPAEGTDYVSMLNDLTDDRWLDPLVRYSPTATLYFNLAPDTQRTLEGSITYNSDEGTAQGLRDSLSNSSLLALTFQGTSDQGAPYAARTPPVTTGVTADARLAYGKGYLLSFNVDIAPYTTMYYGTTAVAPNNLNPNNLLTAITEVDLQNPSNSSLNSWTCDPNRRFLIVQPSDAAVYCPAESYTNLANASYAAEYEIIRHSLKPEYWNINLSYHCAVPIDATASCYVAAEANGSAPVIEYDQTKACYQSITGIPYGTTTPINRCAEYVSICTRN